MRSVADRFDTILCSTGQHRELLDQALSPFGLRPDLDLALMQPSQQLADLTGRALAALDCVFDQYRPDLVIVQGDTTTAFAGALAAYYRRIPVAHLEAGLRTDDIYDPFPEEGNRRLVSCLATVHFAPTTRAASQLRARRISRSAMSWSPAIPSSTRFSTSTVGVRLARLQWPRTQTAGASW